MFQPLKALRPTCAKLEWELAMTEQEIWQRFTDLPTNAQKQVADLISFLHAGLAIPGTEAAT